MKQKIFIVALILGLIVIALLYTLNFNLDSEMEIGNDYKVNYDIYANNEPMFNGGDYPEFSLKINDLVELVEIEGDFAKIKHQEKEGWIPVWYILEESAQIDESASYLRIIDKEASIYLLPIENSPSYSDDYQLEKGKVIKIFATYGDWYCIDFIRYDNPEFDLTWIKKDYTSEYDKSLVKEGCLTEDVQVYYKDGELKDDTITEYVFIEDEQDDFYRFQGIGGQNGYIKKTDFTPITNVDTFQSNHLD